MAAGTARETIVTQPGTPGSAPSVSVVIPTFQRRQYVTAAVRSVLQQRRAPDEVIVVDDGSADDTAGALAGFGDGIRYLYQDHGGLSCARNAGVRAAGGEIVAFLDDDDRWLPGHLSITTEAFASHPEAVLVGTGAGFGFGRLMFGAGPSLVTLLPRLLVGNFVGYPSSVAVRRDALIRAGGFDEHLAMSEAYELWLRLGAIGPACLLRRRTVIRGHVPGSLSKRSQSEGWFLQARRQVGERTAAELAPLSRELSRASQSYQRFVDALGDFDQGQLDDAAAALADACQLMPERSDEPWTTGGWLACLPQTTSQEGKLAAFTWFAEAWPDAASDTALGLRLHGAYLALRARRATTAIALLRRAPRRPILRYLRRLAHTAVALRAWKR